MSDEEIERQNRLMELRAELSDLQELQKCAGYRNYVLPLLVKKEAEHLAGVTSRTGNRDHHVEAWHTVRELKDFVQDRIDRANSEISKIVTESELFTIAEVE